MLQSIEQQITFSDLPEVSYAHAYPARRAEARDLDEHEDELACGRAVNGAAHHMLLKAAHQRVLLSTLALPVQVE